MERYTYTINYTADKGTRFGIWKGETLIKGDFATEKEAKAYLNTITERDKMKKNKLPAWIKNWRLDPENGCSLKY